MDRGPAVSKINRGVPGARWVTPVATVAPAGPVGSVPAVRQAARAAVLSSVPVQVLTVVSGLKVW